MKINIKLIKKLFITTLLLANVTVANASCEGGTCKIDLKKLFNNASKVTRTVPVVSVAQEEVVATKKPISVQVGAFLSEKAASLYGQRYTLMGDQFSTEVIITKFGNEIIYKVQVVGFEDLHEASLFISTYKDIGAFLVSL